jgi:DNA-binding response OmpR family regulator
MRRKKQGGIVFFKMEEKIDKNHRENPLILIVDDSLENLQVMASILTNARYRITMTKSAAKALQILDNITPDLILLDVLMPEMDGFELCRRLKTSETTREIPVIFLTIKADSEDIVKGFQSGGVDYITKPFNKTELLARVQNHLELKRSKEELKERSIEIEEKNHRLEEQSEKLKELDKIKSRFFANISHEFRTPLTLILGPLEQMIAACSNKDEEKKRKLTLMHRNAERLLRLINQLLELSKLESSKMKLQARKTNIISFVKGITDSFQPPAQQKELELVFHAEHENEDKAVLENMNIYIDPMKMEDIMSNILVNDIKFTPPGGEIEVTVKGNPGADPNFPAGWVEISVCDTGPGIPLEQLPHIFDRFFQVDITYEHHQEGSGIGLILAKELLALHHGTIEARSREGEGSAFIIRLPMGSAHLAADEIIQESVPVDIKARAATSRISQIITGLEMEINNKYESKSLPEPGIRTDETNIILVVEDSAAMRMYIRETLEPGYTVVTAADGREGMQKAQEVIPDLIISDIMMPEVDGLELCRMLKNDVKTSHIPIVLLTAKASEENILQGLKTGADDYITKPFSTKLLIARIKNLIDIRSQLQNNINFEMTLQPVKTSVSKIDRKFLRDLQAVIKKNISDPEFNVEELCKKLDMGNTTLYRKIRALCGQTPTDFIRSCRLNRALQLLKSGYGSVTEVAFEVGFSSRAYFTKCFREKFHQLPSDFN